MDKKYIIREVPAEACDFSYYFDDDGLREAGGDFCNTLFIIDNEGWGRISGFNIDVYKEVQKQAAGIIDGFEDVLAGLKDYDGNRYTFKDIMDEYDIPYTSRKCHALKEWQKSADSDDVDDIAAFLTITTGKKWKTTGVHGYSQGDYVTLLYCAEHYKNGAEHYGEVWLGCAKEFYTIELDENGEEGDTCGGYIIADCQASDDADYKRLVCEWACIDENEAQLEMIDGYKTVVHYSYRTA